MNIADCDGTNCGAEVCKNNGVCSVSRSGNAVCTCLKDYIGVCCETHIDCSESNCGKGGVCVKDKTNFDCDCSIGWQGSLCDEYVNITIPNYESESYGLYVYDQYNETDMRESYIELDFKTDQNYGLILWNGKAFVEDSDYLGVGLIQGHLKLVWSLGWQSRNELLTANGSLADGNWHKIVIDRSDKVLLLYLDGYPFRSEVEGDFYELNTHGLYYTGGFPRGSSVSDMTGGHFDKPFVGCISHLTVGKNRRTMNITGVNINNCL